MKMLHKIFDFLLVAQNKVGITVHFNNVVDLSL